MFKKKAKSDPRRDALTAWKEKMKEEKEEEEERK
jgi:hypothetical protein